jgi:hypothetical protein
MTRPGPGRTDPAMLAIYGVILLWAVLSWAC